MIDRCCRWCGFHFDASVTYAGKQRRTAIFGHYRAWCSVQHRRKSYHWTRRLSRQRELLRKKYLHLEQRGQLRFDLDEEP